MNYAWEQIGDVLQANQSIRRLHFATAASMRLYARHLTTVASDPARVLSLTAPVSSRVLYSGSDRREPARFDGSPHAGSVGADLDGLPPRDSAWRTRLMRSLAFYRDGHSGESDPAH